MLLLLLSLGCPNGSTVRTPVEDAGDPPDVPLSVTPSDLLLAPGEHAMLTIVGDDGCSLTWSTSDATVATVTDDTVAAVGFGEATLTATCDDTSASVAVTVALQELRGVWVTRWTYHTPEDVDAIMADVAAAGGNTVLFQVRGRFDAFYASELEPWASELSGQLGRDPGWDPLATAVTAGHARGLQVHAYLNTYPLWSGSSPPASTGVPHPLAEHPDWVVHDEGGAPMALNSSYVFASPGNPDVRAHIVAVAADVAERYDVDGIHLDYIRYPDEEYSHDPASLAAWGGTGDYAAWQRQQILDTLLELRRRTDKVLTAAVWGVYENTFGWSSVSEGNLDYYQDTWAFLREGALDGTMPMIYWPVADTPGERLDFRTLAADHVAHASGHDVYLGIDAASLTWAEVAGCIAASREVGAAGQVLFEYRALRDNGWIDDLADGPWADPAVVPSR